LGATFWLPVLPGHLNGGSGGIVVHAAPAHCTRARGMQLRGSENGSGGAAVLSHGRRARVHASQLGTKKWAHFGAKKWAHFGAKKWAHFGAKKWAHFGAKKWAHFGAKKWAHFGAKKWAHFGASLGPKSRSHLGAKKWAHFGAKM
jgi:hypothetical protein